MPDSGYSVMSEFPFRIVLQRDLTFTLSFALSHTHPEWELGEMDLWERTAIAVVLEKNQQFAIE